MGQGEKEKRVPYFLTHLSIGPVGKASIVSRIILESFLRGLGHANSEILDFFRKVLLPQTGSQALLLVKYIQASDWSICCPIFA